MADRGMTFSAPMVRALLREIQHPGTGKTQTRRDHPPEPRFAPDGCRLADLGGRQCWFDFWAIDRAETQRFKLPYAVGDRLYVREHWRTLEKWDCLAPRQVIDDRSNITYEADPENRNPLWAFGRFRQGMHMPRWASRITLLVTGVKVERLQDCSWDDALAEGVQMETADPPFYYVPDMTTALTAVGIEDPGGNHAQRAYAKLWDHINGPGAWASNPWVAAYTFRPVLGNIDTLEAGA